MQPSTVENGWEIVRIWIFKSPLIAVIKCKRICSAVLVFDCSVFHSNHFGRRTAFSWLLQKSCPPSQAQCFFFFLIWVACQPASHVCPVHSREQGLLVLQEKGVLAYQNHRTCDILRYPLHSIPAFATQTLWHNEFFVFFSWQEVLNQ